MARPKLGKSAAPPLATLLVTLGVAGSLGAVLYGVSSSLPFLASSATSDVNFGALNACALASGATRKGFAVSPDGRSLAVYSGVEAIRCDLLPDGGAVANHAHRGEVTSATFDFSGTLWMSSQGVWSGDAGFPEVSAVALAGSAGGVVALEATGRLVSLQANGAVAAVADLPQPVSGGAELLMSGDGERVALLVAGGVFVWEAARLGRLRAEAPCAVESAWWLPRSHRLLLQCQPDLALEWDVDTGQQTAATPRKHQTQRASLLPGREIYVSSCEQLPCTAAPP